MTLEGYNEENFIVTLPAPFVLHVEINRPEKLNAFNDALWYSLRRIFKRASTDPDVRACVLSARGRAFTAGLDITSTSVGSADGDVGRVAQSMRHHIVDFQDAISSLQACAKPVIACLHGLALGLAIDLASAADIRYASKETSFCIKEVDIGLAADIGSLQRLPKLGPSSSWLREMAMTAAPFTAEVALQQGLVSRVLDSRDACIAAGLETAAKLASKSPIAVQGTKFLLDYSRDHTVEEGLLMTAVWNASMLQSRDVSDSIQAVLTKQKARYAKL